jgi:hypothetical protein
MISRYDNYLWLISCAAERMFPSYLDRTYLRDWITFVWHGVLKLQEQGIEWWDIRWDCVQLYAINRMHYFLSGKPYPH